MSTLLARGARSRSVVLSAVCLAALILPLSFSAGAIATPAIGLALHGGPMALTWITNAFMLAFGSCLMAAGTLADRFGRKRVFIGGVAAFTVISACLACAPTLLCLDLLRAAQGVAAAAALAGGSAALAQEFDGHARTRAFGLLGITFGAGLALGPVLAGGLIEVFGWRAVFLSSALIGGLSLLLAAPGMRETRDPAAASLDWPGIATFTTALGLFTVAILESPQWGWRHPATLTLLVGAVVALSAFVSIERRAAQPMLALALFRYPRFIGVQLLPVATCYCYVVLLVILPLRFVGIEGHTPLDAGLMMIALSAPMLVMPVLAVRLSRYTAPGTICSVGLLIAAAGLQWLGSVQIGATPTAILGPMLLIGAGAGLPWGLMDGLAISVVPKERAGMAAGIFSTTRVAGEGLALAIVSALFSTLTQISLHGALPHANASQTTLMVEAAQRVASGQLLSATTLLPGIGSPFLTLAYADAFRSLCHVLSIITVMSALAVFVFLSRKPSPNAGLDARRIVETQAP